MRSPIDNFMEFLKEKSWIALVGTFVLVLLFFLYWYRHKLGKWLSRIRYAIGGEPPEMASKTRFFDGEQESTEDQPGKTDKIQDFMRRIDVRLLGIEQKLGGAGNGGSKGQPVEELKQKLKDTEDELHQQGIEAAQQLVVIDDLRRKQEEQQQDARYLHAKIDF